MKQYFLRSFGVLLLILLTFQSLGHPLVTPVKAANDQGFEWSVEIGSIFNYSLRANSLLQTSIPIGDYDFYFNLTSLPILEDNITSLDDFTVNGLYHYDLYFQNGTLHPFGFGAFKILPTGNWSLMQSIWDDFLQYPDPPTWINTTTEWGFIGESVNGNIRYTWINIFSKDSGLTQLFFTGEYRDDVQSEYLEFRLDSYSSYPDLIEIQTTSSTPTTTSATSPQPTNATQFVLLFSIAGGIIVILAIVVQKRKS